MTRVSSITSVCECTIANTKDWANVWTLVGNYGSLILQSNQSLVIYMIAVLNCIELLCQEWSYGDAEWKQRNPLLKRNVHWGWSQFNRCNPVSLLQIQSLKIPLSSAAIQPARLSIFNNLHVGQLLSQDWIEPNCCPKEIVATRLDTR